MPVRSSLPYFHFLSKRTPCLAWLVLSCACDAQHSSNPGNESANPSSTNTALPPTASAPGGPAAGGGGTGAAPADDSNAQGAPTSPGGSNDDSNDDSGDPSSPVTPSVSPDSTSAPASPSTPDDQTSAPESSDGGTTTTMSDASPIVSPSPGDIVTDGERFTVDVQLASELDDSAPTTVGVVEWSSEQSDFTSAYIEFGLTTDYGMQAPVDLTAPEHRTLLLGLKPSQTYHFRILASDGATTYSSDDYSFETGPATSAVEIGSFEVLDEAKREPGFTVASYWSGAGSAVAFILDAEGEIVWAYDTGIAGGIARARMSEDGQHMWVVTASNTGGALRRVSMDGLNAETYAATVGSHDITSVSGSTMAYIDYGESDCDSIFEIEVSGETREVWDSEDWFGSAGSGGGAATAGGGRCHGNALRYSAAEDVYTFSDVSTDVVVVSREGEFEWGLADRVSGGVAAWGGRNHGHHLLQDAFVIFANSGGEGGESAVVEYTLEGEEVWRYDSGDSSANLGDVQRLPGGNTLVTFSNDSIVHEVTRDKELVLRWTGSPGTRIGYILWRDSLYGPSPDIHD